MAHPHRQLSSSRRPGCASAERTLVLFADREGNDDVACFEVNGRYGPAVAIRDFTSPGWEQVTAYPSLYAWFRQAIGGFINND